ncbi:MAG: TonB-dependent receptor [Gammaproteobacteria bacterium]
MTARFSPWLTGAGILAALTVTPLSHAQEKPAGAAKGGLEEIIVEARRRQENIQSVPVAVTALSQDALDQRGGFQASDLQQVVPGFRFAATIGNRNDVIFNIRGQDIAFGVLFPAVVPYFADVPITGGPNAPGITHGVFFDLDNVQVLRGPQGTLFGRVTDGGNVMIKPRRPGESLGGYGEVQLGDFDMRGFKGAVNVPINETLAVRAAVDMKARDGFTLNLATGKLLDDEDYKAGRFSVLWKPTDRFENYTVVNYSAADTNGTGVVLTDFNPVAAGPVLATPAAIFAIGQSGSQDPAVFGPLIPGVIGGLIGQFQAALAAQQARGPRVTNYSSLAFYRREDKYLVNETTFRFSENLLFKNIFGYTKIKERSGTDYDGMNLAWVDTPHTFIPYVWQDQWSEEFQIQGKAFGGKLDWILGTYFDEQSPGGPSENYTVNILILQRSSVQELTTNSTAVFGQAGYDLADWVEGLKFNLGVRYTMDDVDSNDVTYLELIGLPIPHGVCVNHTSPAGFGTSVCKNNQVSFDAFTYTTGFDYQLNPDMLLYVKASRGYRPGGFNSSALIPGTEAFQPEFDQSQEIGLKADWSFGDMQARTNLAWFYDDYTDIQKLIVLQGPNNAPVSIVSNTASATITGIEFEGTLIPTDGLIVGLNYAWTDASFNEDGNEAAACPADPFTQSGVGFCTFNRLARTPDHQLTFDVHYTFPFLGFGDLTIGGNYYYQTSVALVDTSYINPLSVEPAYGILNFDAKLSNLGGYPIDLSFFINNATDELYRIGSDDLSHFGSLGTTSDFYGAPRMWGFALKYRFGEE